MFSIAVAAAEAAIGVAILIALFRQRGSSDIVDMDTLKR
jgi:NADH-quinone oxidoreductase subunit K